MKIPHLEKTLIIILVCIILFSINTPHESNEQLRHKIDSLKLSGDSLKNVVKLSGDSLKITVNRINLLQKERDSLAVIANSKQKIYEKVVFKTYTNAQRDSVLRQLYPSATKGN